VTLHYATIIFNSRPDPPGEDPGIQNQFQQGNGNDEIENYVQDDDHYQRNQGGGGNDNHVHGDDDIEVEGVNDIHVQGGDANEEENRMQDEAAGPNDDIELTEEDHDSARVQNRLFQLYFPVNKMELFLKVDIDTVGFQSSNLHKLAMIHCTKDRQFEFFSNFDRWADRTTKSRFNIACDKNYRPTVYNKKRKLFGFEMVKNLKFCKAKYGNIDMVFSVHILDKNKVGNSMFWDDLCGAICLAMNTALVNPEWVTDITEGMSEYREGSKNIEKKIVTKEGRRAFHTVDHFVGAKVLMFFQAALVQYSEQSVEQYDQNGEFKDRKIHLKCYHGLPKCEDARLPCIIEGKWVWVLG
jgi:hypothetical protein